MSAAGLQDVFRHIDQHVEFYLAQLFTLLRQPSISARNEGLEESARLVCELMERSSLQSVSVLRGEENPCPYGVTWGPADSPRVLIYGHHDVQPAEPLSEWVSPPFEPVIRNGRIYARGSGDNKGQMAAHLFAMQSLRAVLGEVPVTVKCLFDGQEESTSPHLPRIVREHRERLSADLLFWADGPFHESGSPVIYCGVRGMLTVEMSASGPNRGLHSGNWGGIAPNPALTLVHLLATLKAPSGRVLLRGFYDRVRPVSAAEREAMDRIPFDRQRLLNQGGMAEFDAPTDLLPYEKQMFLPTFNIAGFQSGYTGPGFSTVIPAEAMVRIDMRLVADQDPDEVYAALEAHVQEHAPGVKLKRVGQYFPQRTPTDHPYVAVVSEAINAAWGEQPLIYPSIGASAPDSVFARELGVPTLLVPYANTDENNHGPNENLRLDCFVRGIKTSAAVLCHLAGLR